MKNLWLLVLVCGTVMFSSCGKDNLAEDILGTWNATLIQFTNCENDSDNITFSGDEEGCGFFDGDMACFSFTFSENGVMSITTSYEYGGMTESETTQGSYTIDGENISFNLDGAFTGTASIDGDQLDISGEAGAELFCDFTFRMVK